MTKRDVTIAEILTDIIGQMENPTDTVSSIGTYCGTNDEGKYISGFNIYCIRSDGSEYVIKVEKNRRV